jgi:hypothetical protein
LLGLELGLASELELDTSPERSWALLADVAATASEAEPRVSTAVAPNIANRFMMNSWMR